VEAFLKEMRRKELANETGHHFKSIIENYANFNYTFVFIAFSN
jgi:hypothetical protein